MATIASDPGGGGELYEADEANNLDTGEISEEAERETSEEDVVTLRPNTVIQEQGIYSYRNRSRAQTVVLIGEQKTGKTTLLAALYGLFCKGPVGEYEFVSSQTLYSFAERNHLALIHPDRADRTVPVTPRTSIGDSVGYFHLKVRREETVSEIIISDRSGETFETARSDTSLLNRLTELAIADRVCFLLDAARLTKLETRHGYRRIFKQTIRALIDNDMIPKTAALEVVVTKTDRISRVVDERDLSAELAEYEEELKRDFGNAGFPFDVHRICALPRAAVSMGVVGMTELVERWVSEPLDADIAPVPVYTALRHIDRLPKIWS